jgi:transcriptional regulator with XRE-family HTH domain
MSQTQLGKLVGLSTNAISQIETGDADPRASKLKAIAKVLGVSADYLLNGEDEKNERLPAGVELVGA